MLEWLLVGGVLGTSSKCKDYLSNRETKRRRWLYQTFVIDQELEKKLWRDVCDPEKREEVWGRIERFKRDNPTICLQDNTNYWGFVGWTRFTTTYAPGEKHTKKRDEELFLARCKTVDLLAVTYGKHSQSQASKISSRGYSEIISRVRVFQW